MQILAGVVDTEMIKRPFLGCRLSGEWVLKYTVKGFDGTHGGRHLYNIRGGGAARGVFFFFPLTYEAVKRGDRINPRYGHTLPTDNENSSCDVTLYVGEKESKVLKLSPMVFSFLVNPSGGFAIPSLLSQKIGLTDPTLTGRNNPFGSRGMARKVRHETMKPAVCQRQLLWTWLPLPSQQSTEIQGTWSESWSA